MKVLKKKIDIIIIEDEKVVAEEIRYELESRLESFNVRGTFKILDTYEKFLLIPLSASQQFIIDINLGSGREREGLKIIEIIFRNNPDARVIVFTAYNSIRAKVQTLGVKNSNFIPKAEFEDSLNQMFKLIEENLSSFPDISEIPLHAFDNDSFKGEDQLDIMPDVNAIGTLIASNHTIPPLSISVFADWGNGKSFFMKKLDQRIRFLSENGSGTNGEIEPSFSKDILTIHFNAWHYIDANLWSSLLSRILTGIAEGLSIKTGNAVALEELYKELEFYKILLEDLKDEQERIIKHQNQAKNRLQSIRKIKKENIEKIGEETLKEEILLREKQSEYKTELIKIKANVKAIEGGKDLNRQIPLLVEKYSQDLGIIYSIRRDLEKLSEILFDKKIENDELNVDRIVLFIDDLDRCPPKKVVEVLQAIHLLLAFPLFVVVVGVDIRWVSHSIEKTYPNLDPKNFKVNDSEYYNMPSSFDYLEKIFQIPFNLKKVDEKGIKQMVNHLLVNDLQTESIDNELANQIVTEGENKKERNTQETSSTIESEQIWESKKLQVSKEERNYIHELAPLLKKSPRALKRFINTYRIIRVHQEGPGRMEEFKAVLLLLAVMIGFPNEGEILFREVERDKHSVNKILDLINRDKKESTPKIPLRLSNTILKIKEETLNITTNNLRTFLPLISRFSFKLNR